MKRELYLAEMPRNDEAITIGFVMASISVNYEPSKFVNYWWLRGSEQITNSFDVQFFADVSHAKNNGFFVFGFEASMEWLRESFEPES